MNKPLPKIYCTGCYKTQDYQRQTSCIHCDKRLNDWKVTSQLAVQGSTWACSTTAIAGENEMLSVRAFFALMLLAV
jgi:hypothetical protein